MLSAANARRQSARAARTLSAVIIAALFSVFSVPIPVGAIDTVINAKVRDGRPSSLTVKTAINGKIVKLPAVTIEGAVHNVTQVIVYVNNTYNTSLPLAAGSETYTVAFGVAPGTHEVRIAGIDAYSNSETSQTVHFTYDPMATAETPGTTTSESETATPVEDYVNQTIDAANVTKEDVAQKVNQASSSGPLGGLSDAMFSVFKSLDLISATDGTGVDKMAGRFTLVSAGLAASIFPCSAYALVEKLRFVPKFAMPNGIAMASMRVLGIALISIPFIFIH